jgi:hypothetical protein
MPNDTNDSKSDKPNLANGAQDVPAKAESSAQSPDFASLNLKSDEESLNELGNFLDDRWSLLISTGYGDEGAGPATAK